MECVLAIQVKKIYIRKLKKLTQKLFSKYHKMKIVTPVLKSLVLVTAFFTLSLASFAKSAQQAESSYTTSVTLNDDEIKTLVAEVKAESLKPSQVITAGMSDDQSESLASKINWLLVIVVVLLVMIIVLVFDILSQVGDIQGKSLINWNGINAKVALAFGILFLVLCSWEFYEHGKLTVFNQTPASEHGPEYDNMFMITVIITGIVFVITQALLFWYTYKYKHSTKRKALFYPDNHKIELLWTVIPAIVLTILVVRGLKTWTAITSNNDPKARIIEVYGFQFDWNARYAGEDNKLGKHDFRQIGIINALGVDTNDASAADDVVTKELHLAVGEPVMLKFRAKDVIHSAYLPHFRVQMNVVPGLPTQFAFTPTLTTAQMRAELKKPTFDYILLCNKICGAAHYRMKMKIVVHTKEDFKKWMAEQPRLVSRSAPASPSAATAAVVTEETKTIN